MDPANKVEYTRIIKNLHNMQWLKSNSMSGHKDKTQQDPPKNMDLENTSSSENMASTSKTTDDGNVTKEQTESVWAKNTNAAAQLFPDVPPMDIQILNEAEMLSMALTESIMTAQLEAIKLKEAEKKEQELERKAYSLIHSDSEEDSIWDKPDRRNVPDDYPEIIKANTVKKQHKGTKEEAGNLPKHTEKLEDQVNNAGSCITDGNSDKDDLKENENISPEPVASMISDESQKEPFDTRSKNSPEEDKEMESRECEKQLITDNNDVAKRDKKTFTTRQKQASTAQKSISYSKVNFNRPTEKSSHFLRKEESKNRPNSNNSYTTHKSSAVEYRYSGNTKKRELSQNREREAEDISLKDSDRFHVRGDATRVINRRQTYSYKKYDTRYVHKHAGSSSEGTNSDPRKEFTASYTEPILSRNPQPTPTRSIKQAMIRNTEPSSAPRKLISPNDKAECEHDLQESDNRRSDDNNNEPDKIIKSLGEIDSFPKDSNLQIETDKCTEQAQSSTFQSDCSSSAMKSASEIKNLNTQDNSQSSIMPPPLLARNTQNNQINVPPEMLRCQNIYDSTQRPTLQSSDITRDTFNGNQNTMLPPQLPYDVRDNNRNTMLPPPTVCPEIYNHPTVSPPPGFYNQQTYPLSNQWNPHMMNLQHPNADPMCGNYLLPQQFPCAPFPDSCFPGMEPHQQAHAFTVSCNQAVHIIDPIYGSCYTIPVNVHERMYRNSQSDAVNNPSFPASGNARSDMRSRESQDIRIGIDVRMNRCQNVYVPEQKQQQNLYGSHSYGNPSSYTLYDDGSGRSGQLNQASNTLMRFNYKRNDEVVDFTAQIGAENKTGEAQVPMRNPRECLDAGFPSRRMGLGRGRLRPRDPSSF